MRPGIFEEKSNNHLKEVTVKIRERYRASTYAQLEETASGDSNRVKEKRFLSFIALGNAVLADEFLARAYNKQESFRFWGDEHLVDPAGAIRHRGFGHAVLPARPSTTACRRISPTASAIPICCT